MFNSKQINNFQERIFNIFIFVSWTLIIFSALGFSQNAPKFLSDLDYYVSIYICLFLMWRFHPFKTKYEFTNLDRKIAFSAGLFIFTTTALHKYLLQVQDQIKKVL
jgi:hypothetical protein